MRIFFVLALIMAFALSLVAAGGKGQHPVQSMAPNMPVERLEPKIEMLPEATNPPIYLDEVVRTVLVEQPIMQPKIITQPIIRQRLVEQPIIRKRIVHQPLIRKVVSQTITQPHIVLQKSFNEQVIDQPVVQPKIIDQTIVQESFTQKQTQREPLMRPATQKKSGGEGEAMNQPTHL